MTNNRYFSSFVISALVYITIIVAIIYLLAEDEFSYKEALEDKVSAVSFSIISPVKVEEPKPKEVIKKKPKPVVKKPKPKPKAEKIQEPKLMPEVVIPEPEEEPEVLPTEEPVVEEPKEEPKLEEEVETTQELEEEVLLESTTNETSQLQKEKDIFQKNELKAKQNKFLNDLRELINQNKSYPRTARRRSIQGEVEVRFNILANGTVNDIHVISGRGIFKKSAIQAIKRSFPIKIDTSLFSFPKEFKITISYILK